MKDAERPTSALIIPFFFCIFQKNSAMATLADVLNGWSHMYQISGYNWNGTEKFRPHMKKPCDDFHAGLKTTWRPFQL